jgi:hypothetical protein
MKSATTDDELKQALDGIEKNGAATDKASLVMEGAVLGFFDRTLHSRSVGWIPDVAWG